MKKRLLTIIILAGGITILASPLQATQHEAEPEQPGEQQQQEGNTVPPVQENTTSPESFVPTESISEDLSVPFPVDI